MKSIICYCALIFLNFLSFYTSAQKDLKLYIDYDRKFVDSAKASFYSIYKESTDTIVKSGSIETYFINGTLLKKVEYTYGKDNKRKDKETYYYENGSVESITNSIELQFDGEQTAYFPNGKIKRKAFYTMNERKEGVCYTSEGKDTMYYETADRLPSFPGGLNGLQKFIWDNLKYPKKAKRKGISGTVEVSVVIDKFGNLSKSTVTKSVNTLLDNEALRVINKMPKWISGFQKDQLLSLYQPIKVKFE